MLRKVLYPYLKSFIETCAVNLDKRGFTPNQLTLAGCAMTFIAGCLYAKGIFFLGGIVVFLSGAADILDGQIARMKNITSDFGAFLDSTMDRYADFFLFGGLILYFAKEGEGLLLLITLGSLLGAYVTSYAKSRAETLGEPCKVGFFTRVERMVVLLICTIISPLLPIGLWILFFGSNITAIQRILHVRKSLIPSQDEESKKG